MRDIIKKILFPNKIIGFILFNWGFASLIYVFANHLEDTVLAYVSYISSFYALVIFSIWFYNACKFSNDFIKESKIYRIYQENFIMVTKVSIIISFLINLMYGVFELVVGIYYKSWWFITFAIYYLLLCFMKVSLAKNIKNGRRGYVKLKQTGIFLLFLNIVFIGMVVLIIRQDRIINYNEYIIYLVALYDFYLIIMAFINVLKYRKKNNPIIIASKCLNFTVAMVSMISLEVAMVSKFGNNDAEFKNIMTSLMGLGIFIINSLMSIYMIYKANKHKEKQIK